MSADMILAIAAIIAVILSIVSIFITTISIRKQEEYNRNSVRPICSIYLTNYDNLISVRIENDGTGPLIIKSITCVCNDGDRKEHQSIFDLLPKDIEQKEFYRILVGESGNYSISPNEKLYLISIIPKDGKTLQKLREFLKTITVYVKYFDIYGKEYNKEKKLAAFNKDLEIRMPDVERYHLWN